MDSAKIFIDTDNEITFILEKVLTAKADRVVLIIPDRASLFSSITSLKLIKRVIDTSNKLLVLVTLDDLGAQLARKAGLCVVARVGEADAQWDEVQKSKFEFIKSRSKSHYKPSESKDESPISIEVPDEVKSAALAGNMISLSQLLLAEPSRALAFESSEALSEESISAVPEVNVVVEAQDLESVSNIVAQKKTNNAIDEDEPLSISFNDLSVKDIDNNYINEEKNEVLEELTSKAETPVPMDFGMLEEAEEQNFSMTDITTLDLDDELEEKQNSTDIRTDTDVKSSVSHLTFHFGEDLLEKKK